MITFTSPGLRGKPNAPAGRGEKYLFWVRLYTKEGYDEQRRFKRKEFLPHSG